MKKKSILFLALLAGLITRAYSQAAGEVEMADRMRSDGKIYVVVAVMCIVFSGIALYLVWLDRKLGKLEKRVKEKNN